jgi:hypothetical protein
LRRSPYEAIFDDFGSNRADWPFGARLVMHQRSDVEWLGIRLCTGGFDEPRLLGRFPTKQRPFLQLLI